MRFEPVSRCALCAAMLFVACKKDPPEPEHYEPALAAKTAAPRPPKAPPKLTRAPTMPALPALPTLSQQEKHPVLRDLPSFTSYQCGAVWNGESMVPLDCLPAAGSSPRAIQRTVVALVAEDRMPPRPAPLPNVVDHRQDGTEGPVRAQGETGTCTAMALAAAIDHAVARFTGKPVSVSSMQLWARYHTTTIEDALEGSAGKSVAAESTWPFSASAWAWRPCSKEDIAKKSACGQPMDAKRLADVDKKPIVDIEQVEWVPKDFGVMRTKLASGQDVIVGMRVGESLGTMGKPGARYVADYEKETGGHLMLVAGYALMPADKGGGAGGDNYYLLHNSWGTSWGDGGYAWIHEATLKKHMVDHVAIVDAHPADDAQGSRHRAHRACAAGTVPDSITGECAAPCDDKSPRHDGVCPHAKDCPDGYVNLTGTCVMAAPRCKGSDGGISWECGAAGCAYWLPKGKYGCDVDSCAMSCPAPAFRAARDARGLTCIE